MSVGGCIQSNPASSHTGPNVARVPDPVPPVQIVPAASNPTALVPMIPLYPTEPPKVKSGFKSVLTAEDAKSSRIVHSELLRKSKKNKNLQEHRAGTHRGVDDTAMHQKDNENDDVRL
jgi:hypothetical protein